MQFPMLTWTIAFALVSLAAGYEANFSEKDALREVCSGMWANANTFINVSFSDDSTGRLAMVIYEFEDIHLIGKVTNTDPDYPQRTYVCTSDALRAQLCDISMLGKFIVELPGGKTLNETSIWSDSIGFQVNSTIGSTSSRPGDGPAGGNPNGPINSTTNLALSPSYPRQSLPSDPGVIYNGPIHYVVPKKGYYCVGTVPVTLVESSPTTTPTHASFKGTVLFRNAFDGQLPAADYPKIMFYFVMTLLYLAIGGGWGFLCYKHKEEIVPIQFYVSALIGFLIMEMFANWAYYRYLNAHGGGVTSTAFLIVVAILDAGRNALSFFLLLVVSLGLSVVREELPSMTRCKALAIAHFCFGVMYAIAVVEIELETVSVTIVIFFVLPLAFTLTAFLLWIMYGLQGTIGELASRKQTYKLSMFRRLHIILTLAMLVILGFFVVTSLSFSSRYKEDFAAQSWPYRWWLMDGYLTILYLLVFSSIAFLWRPTGHNRR
ncbi:hypothetical protein BS47DRAFT_1382191 [Hydnum rufescens UP504]|uniref:Uncharacterized protein n=1 Tax=Hydnum rufescens UP504 TaxID=1448309 RepID=A0A9P6DXF9_9AGAM|nr:hypothetical protein BS47DRAFT_1382191 [Hydnum rufescens UP504]